MEERVVVFGNALHLVGIVTLPSAEKRSAQLPAVVILNSGQIPRVGPHRLSVLIARRLAELGCTVLRFDLAGLGDSGRRPVDLPYPQNVVQDIGAALDQLAKTGGQRRFILAGTCSGADNALRAAAADARVVGAVLIDGLSFTYPTPGFYLRHYGKRVFHLRRWRGLATRGLRALLARFRPAVEKTGSSPGVAGSFGSWVPERPPRRSTSVALFRSLVDRGVELSIIYSGGISDYYNYQGQFADSFREVDFKNRLVVEYLPGINHTFTELHAQDWLVQALTRWLGRSFPEPVKLAGPAGVDKGGGG